MKQHFDDLPLLALGEEFVNFDFSLDLNIEEFDEEDLHFDFQQDEYDMSLN